MKAPFAEVSQRGLIHNDTGEQRLAWVVQCGENTIVFSGPDGSEWATAYARSIAERITFRLMCQTGIIGVTGHEIGRA